MILLDTSYLIRALVAGSTEDANLRAWLKRKEEIAMSAIAWAEFLCGPVTAEHIRLAQFIVGEPQALLAEDAVLAATLFNAGGRRRGSLTDSMIAATAIRLKAALATVNAKDFRRYAEHGLRLA